MNKLRIFGLALLSTAAVTMAQAKDYTYQTVKGDLMGTRIYTLDNGLKVYLSVNKEKPRIQTYIAVRTGSRNDPAETTGLAHYLEHLMFKGTKSYGTSDYSREKPLLDEIKQRFENYRTVTDEARRRVLYHEIDSVSQLAARYNIPNEYDKLMASIGAQGSNAYTNNDVTCYQEDIPSNEVENYLKIQSDRFQNMVIRGFHTELEAVYEEKNISLAKDNRKSFAALNALLFPGHPYGTQTTLGTQEHLKNPSIVNIERYFHRYYAPNNVAVCMSGDFDPDVVIAQVDKYFGAWKPNPGLSRPEYPALKPIVAPKDTSVVGLEAENVMLGWRFKGLNDLQMDTVSVVAQMLSNGKAGMLELDLEQTMKVQAVQAFDYGLAEYSGLVLFGMPVAGQKLEDVRGLLLGEMEKFKRGEFSGDLLESVKNNMKLDYYNSLLSNEDRASKFVDAFVNGMKWEDVANRMQRIAGITRQQIIDFANRYLKDNYVCVYKRMGEDNTIKKIDKPQITAIPTNRDMSSRFLNEIKASKTEPIQPKFLDFEKDLTVTKTAKGLPVLYRQNTDDGLFNLAFRYEYGTDAVKDLDLVPQYLYYLGTDKKTSAQIKEEFYKLACDYSINVGDRSMTISLSGLNENMPKALALLEDFLKNAKGDKESYDNYVALIEKSRQDAKSNQEANFKALRNYGFYGPYNSTRNVSSVKELAAADPQRLPQMLSGINGMQHTVMYFGPSSLKQLMKVIDKNHPTPKHLTAVPQGKHYEEQTTPKNEILLAPYEAKNIYMIQYNNENRQWNPSDTPVELLFNDYFGGGMNTIVFQELREARGLAYSAYANYRRPAYKGNPESFMTYIISQNDKMMDCIRTFEQIIDTIPQSQAAFDIAKQNLIKSLQSERTTRFSVLGAYLSAQQHGIDYDINRKVYEALPSVTLQDVVRFEQENIARKPFRYLILGDEKNLDIKALEKIAPVRRLTTEEIFGY